MALYNPEPGLGMVAEYQASGTPAVGLISSATTPTVTFTLVTRAITVWTTNNAVIKFDSAPGADTITLVSNVPLRIEVKTKYMEVTAGTGIGGSGAVNFIAELTAIAEKQCPIFTNANNELFSIV
jgi:hypothetical protein